MAALLTRNALVRMRCCDKESADDFAAKLMTRGIELKYEGPVPSICVNFNSTFLKTLKPP